MLWLYVINWGNNFFPAIVHWSLVFQCCIICVVSQKPAIILYFATVFLAKQSTETQRGSDRKLKGLWNLPPTFCHGVSQIKQTSVWANPKMGGDRPIQKLTQDWKICQSRKWQNRHMNLRGSQMVHWHFFPEELLIWSNSNLVTTVLNLDTLLIIFTLQSSCHWAGRRPGRAFCSFRTTGGILPFCVRLWPCCVTDWAACQRRWIQRAYLCVLWAQQQPLSRRCYVSLGRGT